MSYRPGERLVGGYEVLELLGRGAYGTVLKVKALSGGRTRAIKVLHCDGLCGGENGEDAMRAARDAAFAEARLLQRLRYPHIVGCEDVIWDTQHLAVQLVLEFMDGGDLRSLIEARKTLGDPFEAHFARRVLAAVGGALVYIHAAGILHRDVKPANVLLTRHSQRIKLADFGIAKLLESSQTNTVVGTPHYLSPEIVSGQAYGEPSDAWALGVCLFEVIALHRPFDAGNQLALVRRICEERVPPLPEHVAPDVRRAIEGLLVKKVEDRLNLPQALAVSSAVAALVVGGVGASPSTAFRSLRGRGGAVRFSGGRGSWKRPTPLQMDGLLEEADEELRALAASSTAHEESSNSSGSFLTGSLKVGSGEVGQALPSGNSSLCSPPSSLRSSASLRGHVPSGPSPEVHEDLGPTGAASEDEDSGVWGALQSAWCCSEAAVAARDALGGDVDDPEELVRALVGLEREAQERKAAPELTGESPTSAAALSALESELRVRIAALRDDAAAMLTAAETEVDAADDGANGGPESQERSGSKDSAEESDEGESYSTPSGCSSPRASYRSSRAATALEQALEVATSLGVDTEPSEERLAKKRGMLSLRVTWAGVARFCMLPINVGFDSLVAEVSRRFGLSSSQSLPPLSWREAGESFELKSQACWEECLQRRGLVAQPGRLELCVDSVAPPPSRTVHLRNTTRTAALEAFASAPSPLGHRPELFTWRMSGSGQSLSSRAPTLAGPRGRPNPAAFCAPRSLFRAAGFTGPSLAPAPEEPLPPPLAPVPASSSSYGQRTLLQQPRLFRAGLTLERQRGPELPEAWAGSEATQMGTTRGGLTPSGGMGSIAMFSTGCSSSSAESGLPPWSTAFPVGPSAAPQLAPIAGPIRAKPILQVRCRALAAAEGRLSERVSPHGHSGSTGLQLFGHSSLRQGLQVSGRAVPLQ